MTAVIGTTACWIIWPVVLAVCMGLDSLYSGMETGIYVLNKIRLDLHAEAGSKPARLIQQMLRRPNNLLTVLLIGTNLARYVATFAISAMFVLAGFGRRAEWLTLITATPLLFVISDSIPKSVFHRLAERVVYRLAWLLRVSDVVFKLTGISYLVRGMSWAVLRLTGACGARQGLHEVPAGIVAEARASGVLTDFQSVMAERVMHLPDVTLADVMIPMRRVVSAPGDVTRQQATRLFAEHNTSRVPLLDAGGRVVGVLDLYDVLAAEPASPPVEKMAPPLLLSAETPVTDALYHMQRAHAAMAIVEASDGRHVGIVTVKDLVEEIVGELEEW